jgi:copper chaperone CopZ
MRHALLATAVLVLAACAGPKAATATATATATPASTPTATATPGTATVSLPVAGMTCGGCARRVTNALLGVDGVADAKVILAEKRAVVSYDPARVQPAALAAAVREAGYEPGEPAPVRY